MSYQPKSILVTGGAGFIGSNFIRYVLSQNPHMQVINLDKLTYAATDISDLSKFKNYHFIRGDIIDRQLIRHVLQHNHIDTIVHFAAESHVDRSIKTPTPFVETNVLGTFELLEAARYHWFEIDELKSDHCRFHHISTDEVYGSLKENEPPFNEKSSFQPRSPYSATKASSDHLVNAYYHTYGLPITISHCSNNYGPYQHYEKFIPTIILGCLNWQRIPIYGQGKNIRDWLHVEDHCRGILTVLQEGKIGECYDMGANNEWENITLARYICQQMDTLLPRQESYSSLLEFVTDRPGHDFRYAIDAAKIKQQLGWSPSVTFESGIKKTIEFYLQLQSKISEQ